MAQKRFSRLSVMLEARDKMTRPMQNAARASQNLQRSVGNLNNSTSRSAQGMNRLVNQVNNSRKSFNLLNNSMTRAMRDSALVYASNKLLTNGYKLLNTAVKGLKYSLQDAGKNLVKFITSTKMFNSMSRGLQAFKTDLKLVNLMFKDSIQKTKVWQSSARLLIGTLLRYRAAKVIIKDVANTMAKSTVNTIKNNKAIQLLNRSLDNTKRKVVATRLAFTLWKNSSTFMSKLSGDVGRVGKSFSWLGNQVKKLIPSFSFLKRNAQGANQQMNQLGNRRATFNQLADANARLNREIAKMNRELSKANSKLGSLKSSMGSLNHMGAAFGAAYAGQAAGQAAGQIGQATVGRAMEQQYSSASVGILAGPEKGAAYYKQIQEYAASTAYSTEDWARNMRGAISKSKSVEDLEKYQMAIEQLATLDPVQGLDGAALAIRELNSGDIVSLVERFELPRKELKKIKDIKDPIEQIGKLMEVVGTNTGYTVENIAKMKELPLMQWQKMTNSIKTAMGYIGMGALEKLAPLFKKFNDAWDAGKFKPFIKTMGDGLTSVTTSIINFATNAGSHFDSFKEKFAPFIKLFNNVKGSLKEGWPTIISIFDNVRGVFGQIASDVNSQWPLINDIFQGTLKVVKDVSGWINDHWPAIKDVLIAVGGAVVVFKGIMVGMKIVKAVSGFMKLWRSTTLWAAAAQTILNGSVWAFPGTWIVAAIAAVIGIAILLYRNWDIVRKKTGELWDKLGAAKGVVMLALGPIGMLVRAAVTLAENWDNTKGVWENVWNGMKIMAENTVNEIVDSINWMIEKINKIPGVNIPIIPKIDLGGIEKSKKEMSTYGYSQAPRGNGHHGGIENVPYNGYLARLHEGERVQTRSEVKQDEKKQAQALITGNQFIIREEADIDKVADRLFRKLQQAQGV